MATNKELVADIKAHKNMLVDILTSAVDSFSAQLEESNIDSREAFKSYCEKQESSEEQKHLLWDLQEANPDALDAYYYERVQEDEHYMSCDDVDSDYVYRDDITTDWLSENMDDSFMEECSDKYMSDIHDDDTFVEHVMKHMNVSRARIIVKEIINQYL